MDLVASGLAKDATEQQLEDFLKAKRIDGAKVECLTKEELITEKKVRSKTMKVTVKAAQLEKAMDPSVWPFRVGVIHYRAPQQSSQGAGDGSWASQSAQTGGRLEDGRRQGSSGQDRRQQRYLNPKNPAGRQQHQMSQKGLEILNMFATLVEQPAP